MDIIENGSVVLDLFILDGIKIFLELPLIFIDLSVNCSRVFSNLRKTSFQTCFCTSGKMKVRVIFSFSLVFYRTIRFEFLLHSVKVSRMYYE